MSLPILPTPSMNAGLRGLIVLLALSFAITTPGCSIFLPLHAYSIRSRFPPGLRVPRSRMAKVVSGAKIDLVLASGDSVRGRFEGTSTQSLDEYTRVYEVWRRDSAATFPVLKSRIKLETAGVKTRGEKFVGFGWRSILVGSASAPRELPLSSFDTLRTAAGTAIASTALTELRVGGTPPCRTGILVRTPEAGVDAEFERVSNDNGGGVRFVPADAVEAIVIRGTVAPPAVYFLVGLVLDTAVGVAIAASMQDQHPIGEVQCDPSPYTVGVVSMRGTLEPLDREFDLRTGMPVPATAAGPHARGPMAAAP